MTARTITCDIPDDCYPELMRRAAMNQRSVRGEISAILGHALRAKMPGCEQPSDVCPLDALAVDTDGTPLAVIYRQCDRMSDPRDNPNGNEARY